MGILVIAIGLIHMSVISSTDVDNKINGIIGNLDYTAKCSGYCNNIKEKFFLIHKELTKGKESLVEDAIKSIIASNKEYDEYNCICEHKYSAKLQFANKPEEVLSVVDSIKKELLEAFKTKPSNALLMNQ